MIPIYVVLLYYTIKELLGQIVLWSAVSSSLGRNTPEPTAFAAFGSGKHDSDS